MEKNMEKLWDVVVVGGGPAGLAAALYALRNGKKTVIIEKGNFGGQIALTAKLQNYPAIAEISGEEYTEALMGQCSDLGAEFELGEVTGIKKNPDYFELKTADGEEYHSKAVILALGTKKRPLGVPGEDHFGGKGVSYCALCDGAFYSGESVAVVGGGNTAVQEALMLSDICKKVYIIHRRGEYRAEEKTVGALRMKENIEEILDSEVQALNGEESLKSVSVKNRLTGDVRDIEVSGLFILIGYTASNKAFEEYAPLDAEGFFDVGESCESGVSGLFVAGDCRRKEIRQVVTAVSDGATAAAKVIRYLDSE